jgi:hypothetical protein
VSACKSCPAPVRWARTVYGTPMLLDRAPRPDGNVIVFGEGVRKLIIDALGPQAAEEALEAETARVLVVGNLDALEELELGRYVAHFATCPKANDHRRERAVAAHPAGTQGTLL